MERFVEDYKGEEFDIIVIGGGITGAAVAYDASSRGLKVALLEKNDFGCATSSATSKLIHGGLRYLNNMEIGLVRESLRERRILEDIAPNFVYPIPFMLPNYDSFMNNKWVIKAGLTIYDILSYDKTWTWDKSKKVPRHKTISKDDVLEIEPNVHCDKLTGASIYYDCQSIFPERLTLAFIKSAIKYGANVANYATVSGFIYKNGKRIIGVKVTDNLMEREIEIKGGLVVNCGGPWADIILNIAENGESSNHIRRSEGIHLITKKLVNENAVVLKTKSDRHFFVVPWRGHSLIGTTDKDYVGNPDDYTVTRAVIEEFLQEINETFGDGNLKYEDIKFAYGGLRPIVDEQTEGTYKSSRKYEIYDNSKDGYEGLITVEGGKYTTSRNLAAKVMKMIGRKLKRRTGKPITDKIHLYGCEINDLDSFMKDIKKENADIDERTIEYLGRNYGTEYKKVIEIARSDDRLLEPLNEDGEILAEVVYAIRNEMAINLSDILFRRTGLGTLGHPGDEVLERIAGIAAAELKWNDERMREEIREVSEIMDLPVVLCERKKAKRNGSQLKSYRILQKAFNTLPNVAKTHG